MKKNEFVFPSADGVTMLHAVEWYPEKKPVAVLQVVHGITEYIDRYEQVAEFFTEEGIIVAGHDCLGHGRSVSWKAPKGCFGETGSWKFVVDDIETCRSILEERHPGLSLCLLGFSLGSFAVREHLIRYAGAVKYGILVGTGQSNCVELAVANLLASVNSLVYGDKTVTPLIMALTNGTYNPKHADTDWDWLCANSEAVYNYLSDDNRTEGFTGNTFSELMRGMAFVGDAEHVRQMAPDTKILIYSGMDDPVGKYGEGVRDAYNLIKSAGVEDVFGLTVFGQRHDVFHEADWKMNLRYIYWWMKSRMGL